MSTTTDAPEKTSQAEVKQRVLTPLQQLWAEKITSIDQLHTLIDQSYLKHSKSFRFSYGYTRCYVPSYGADSTSHDHVYNGYYHSLSGGCWWIRREMAREQVGLYPEPTSVLIWLRSMYGMAGQYFPHISRDDPTMVAYTPDQQAGFQDKQVRLSMGKLLRKFLPLLTDAYIIKLESDHRSELSDEFEVATTIEDIEWVYNNMDGDTACMRHHKSNWNHKEFHPSAVYCAPGMGVAFLRSPDGLSAKARSVIWVNPQDPTDKRYVRRYGDTSLTRRLERQGFRMAGLLGAKIGKLRDSSFVENHSDHEDRFVMPYLDKPGGPDSPCQDMNGVYVVTYKGDDFLTVIDRNAAHRIQQAGGYALAAQNTSGGARVREIDPSLFRGTCGLSGKPYDVLTDDVLLWVNEDGTVTRVLNKEIDVAESGSVACLNICRDNLAQRIYTKNEWLDKFRIPTNNGPYPNIFNDEVTRSYFRMVELEPKYYGPGVWTRRTDEVRDISPDSDTQSWIRRSDSYAVHDVDGGPRYVHSSEVKSLRRQGYVTVPPVGGIKRLAHGRHPQMVTTISGRRVLTSLHDGIKLFTGQWETSRRAFSRSVLGATYYTSKDIGDRGMTRDEARRFSQNTLQDCTYPLGSYAEQGAVSDSMSRLAQFIRLGGTGTRALYKVGDSPVGEVSGSTPATLEQMIAAARWIDENADNTEAMAGFIPPGPVVTWARASIALYEMTLMTLAFAQAKQEQAATELMDETFAIVA